MRSFAVAQARSWIATAAAWIEANATQLSELDAAIGDGDHGANMTRGMHAVAAKIGAEFPDLGALFKTVGMTLLSTVGGASGPLYGGFFLAVAKPCAGLASIESEAWADALAAGAQDIARRGKAQPGDKTMLDAMLPALEALRAAGPELAAATAAAAVAARKGAEATTPLLARKGRASYLGERSIGHQDPGATSCALLFEALAEACH